MPRIYEVGPIAPSGHGSVFRGHVKNLIDSDHELTVRTQAIDWSKRGELNDGEYPDSRFRNKIVNSGRFNERYLVENRSNRKERREFFDNLGSAETANPEECIVRDFEGKEDVWHYVGDVPWAEQKPTAEDIYTILETDWSIEKVPRRWKYYTEKVDEVWVPNEWVKKAYTSRGIDNVKTMPYGVDFSYEPTDYDCEICPSESHTKPSPGSGQCLNDSKFNFVAFSRWVHRKGWDKLIEAFLREFNAEDPARLIIKTSPGTLKPLDQEDVMDAIRSTAEENGISNIPEIFLNVSYLSNQHLFDLLGDVSDCFVMPSRGECVGIAWIQAMHCRTPVITTDWSAMNEYLTDEHAILLKNYKLEKPNQKVGWLNYEVGKKQWPPDAKWADPQVQELQQALRKAYEMKEQEKNKMTKKARKHVHQLFDWNKHIQKRIKRYKEVTN